MPCGNYDAYDYFFNQIFKRFFTWECLSIMDCTFIGIAIAGLTAPVSGYFFIGQLTVIYGFVATCIVLPIVFKRLKAFPLQTSIKPNTSTICAPFSLVAAAYVIAFPKANTFIVIILLLLAQIFYFTSLYNCLNY